jgi:hypothetical protein
MLAHRVVVLSLVMLAALGGLLLAASMAPSESIVRRFAAVSGELRTGSVTQALVTHLAERLRLAGSGFVLLCLGMLVVRQPLEEVAAAGLAELPRGVRVYRTFGTDALTVVLLVVVAAGARAVFLDQPMRYDEALSFNEFASRPLYYALSFYPEPNNHLLNTLLMHAAYVVFGNQPWALRLPAFAAGVLLVPATYVLGRLLSGRAAGLGAAALVAASSYLVEYSTNARGYTLEALSFVVLFSLAIVAVRHGSRGAMLLGAAVAGLGFYAVPTMVYGLAVVAVWLARNRHSPIRPAEWAAVALVLAALVGFLYLPVVVISGPEALIANRFVVPLGLDDLVAQLPASLGRAWLAWHRDLGFMGASILLVGCFVASVFEARRGQLPTAVLAIGACAVIVLLQRVAPFERVWLFLLPLYLIVASAGLVELVGRRISRSRALHVLPVLLAAAFAGLTVVSGSVIASPDTGVFPDAEEVAASLSGRLGGRDAVVSMLPASLPELQYYFPRARLGIDSLVREPSTADHVYVIVPLHTAPTVAGWSQPVEVGRYRAAALFELTRRE